MAGQLSLPVIQPRPADAPHMRSQCRGACRPCPWFSCRYHLWSSNDIPGRRWKKDSSEANSKGQVRRHTETSCALDVAETSPDGKSQDEVGVLMGLTGERVRQVEERAISRMKLAMRLVAHNDGECEDNCEWCSE